MVKPRPSILIVDDDADTLATLSEFLRQELGATLTTHSDAAAALDGMGPRYYDLVLADLRMPEMDGIEFLARVRAVMPQAKLVLFTADPRVVQRPDATRVADAVLLKPLETQPFLARMRRLLKPAAPGDEGVN